MRIYGPGALGSLPSPKSGVDKTWKVTSLAMRMSVLREPGRSASGMAGRRSIEAGRASAAEVWHSGRSFPWKAIDWVYFATCNSG